MRHLSYYSIVRLFVIYFAAQALAWGAGTSEALDGDKPVIYLFGETHYTLEAYKQQKRILQYCESDQVMFAVENVFPEFDNEGNIIPDIYGGRNTIGCDNALFDTLMGMHHTIATCQSIQNFQDRLEILSILIAQGRSTELQGIIDSALNELRVQKEELEGVLQILCWGLLNSGCHDAILYVANEHSVQQVRAFAETLLAFKRAHIDKIQALSPLRNLYWEQNDLFYKKAVETLFLQMPYTDLNELLIQMAEKMWGYAANIELPDKTKVNKEFVNHCKKTLRDLKETTVEQATYIAHRLAAIRDIYIVHNLEQIYPIASERGMQLVGIYGENHIPSLKTKLEAKGFRVVADDMAALERALRSAKHRQHSEL